MSSRTPLTGLVFCGYSDKLTLGGKTMKKMPSLVVLVFLLILAAIVPVHATPPVPVEGSFAIIVPRVDGCEILEVCGYFEGTLAECVRGAGGSSVGYFEGTVDGHEGTLVFNLVSFGNTDFGQWTILSGTGELANLRGQGMSYTDGTYDGRAHFDPAP
jgi:hypothetical protein